jgi:hypothetical protein
MTANTNILITGAGIIGLQPPAFREADLAASIPTACYMSGQPRVETVELIPTLRL